MVFRIDRLPRLRKQLKNENKKKINGFFTWYYFLESDRGFSKAKWAAFFSVGV